MLYKNKIQGNKIFKKNIQIKYILTFDVSK